jgi:hypothetical protein
MNKSRNNQRANNRAGNQSRVARNVTAQAIKRLKGFAVSTKVYDPPTYKQTPIISFKQRVQFNLAGSDTVILQLNDIFTTGSFDNYKFTSLQAWAVSSKVDDYLDINMTYNDGGEDISTNDTAGANHHATVKIIPPTDDWFSLATNNPEIQIQGNGPYKVLVDIVIRARLNLPVIVFTPPATAKLFKVEKPNSFAVRKDPPGIHTLVPFTEPLEFMDCQESPDYDESSLSRKAIDSDTSSDSESYP